MRIRNTGGVDPGHLDHERFAHMPDQHKVWLKDTLGERPSIQDLDDTLRSNSITEVQRRILQAFRRSLVGDVRVGQGEAIVPGQGAMSVMDLQTRNLGSAFVPAGRTKVEERIEQMMPAALVGHEDQMDAFVEFGRRTQSPILPTLPLLALSGQKGQGKEQALATLAQAIQGDEAHVVTVDLRNHRGNSLGLFGADGLLGAEALKSYMPGYTPPKGGDDAPEEVKPAIVRIKGADNLAATDADMFRALGELLSRSRRDPNFVPVPMVMDFDQPATDDPRELLKTALNGIGTRNVVTARFDTLSPDVIMQYARQYMQDTLHVALEMSPKALDVLSRALGTPHDALGELEPRMYEFLVRQFDTQLDGSDKVVTVRVNDSLLDPQIDGIVEALHQPDADLTVGHNLFNVEVAARLASDDGTRDVALQAGKALVQQMQGRSVQLAALLPTGDAATDESLNSAVGAMSRFARMLGDITEVAAFNHGMQEARLLERGDYLQFQQALKSLKGAAKEIRGLAGLSPELRQGLGEMLGNWVAASQKIGGVYFDDGPLGTAPPLPNNEAPKSMNDVRFMDMSDEAVTAFFKKHGTDSSMWPFFRNDVEKLSSEASVAVVHLIARGKAMGLPLTLGMNGQENVAPLVGMNVIAGWLSEDTRSADALLRLAMAFSEDPAQVRLGDKTLPEWLALPNQGAV